MKNKEDFLNKIIDDLPMAEFRGQMTKDEWKGWFEDAYNEGYKQSQALQLQQTGVIRSAFAVIPDAEKLGIGNNKITAVFKHKHQAEAWAKSMWEDVYIIEKVRTEHFL